jgi:hypothetical protein
MGKFFHVFDLQKISSQISVFKIKSKKFPPIGKRMLIKENINNELGNTIIIAAVNMDIPGDLRPGNSVGCRAAICVGDNNHHHPINTQLIGLVKVYRYCLFAILEQGEQWTRNLHLNLQNGIKSTFC